MNHYLSTLTAPTPVTVEAITIERLRAAGFFSTYYMGQWQKGMVIVNFLASGGYRVDLDGKPCHPRPETMEDLTRLSRPKPQ